jgi:hypothetical protein
MSEATEVTPMCQNCHRLPATGHAMVGAGLALLLCDRCRREREALPQTNIVDAAFDEWWNSRQTQPRIYDGFVAGYAAAVKCLMKRYGVPDSEGGL